MTKNTPKKFDIPLPALREGDIKNEVYSLKYLLQCSGYKIGPDNNVLDHWTWKGLQRYRRVNHLAEVDYCDENTWKSLLNIEMFQE